MTFYRGAVAVLAVTFIGIGVALLAVTAANGGGVLGFLLGGLFIAPANEFGGSDGCRFGDAHHFQNEDAVKYVAGAYHLFLIPLFVCTLTPISERCCIVENQCLHQTEFSRPLSIWVVPFRPNVRLRRAQAGNGEETKSRPDKAEAP